MAATGGTAAGTDYTLSPSVTLAAGDTSVTASVTAVADGVIEGGDETVVVTASHGDGSVGSATITIEDNDTPTWSVTAEPATVAEGQASTVTVSVDKTFETAQTIALAATGGTAAGTDYTLSPSSLTLDAGAKTATATVTAVDDNDEESDETVVVTASHDSSAVGSVTITIEAVAPLPPGVVWGDRLPDRDIALPGAPTGVWSNGTDVWVLTTAGRISVYSLADGAEHTDRGFTLPGGAEYAAGLWSNGATLWVADVNRGWVRAYRLSDGARQADRDLDTAALAAAGNTEPAGIWSNGTTMWVADFTDSRVYAYDLTTKAPRRRQRTRPRQEPRRDLQPLRHLVQRRHAAGRLLARRRDHRPQPHRRATPTSQRPLHLRQQNQLPQRHLVQRPHPLGHRRLRRNPLRLRRPRPRRTTQRHAGLRQLAVSSREVVSA